MAAIEPTLHASSTKRAYVWTAALGINDTVTVDTDGAAYVLLFSSAANSTAKIETSAGLLANVPSGIGTSPTATAAGFISRPGRRCAISQAVNTANVEVHVFYHDR